MNQSVYTTKQKSGIFIAGPAVSPASQVMPIDDELLRLASTVQLLDTLASTLAGRLERVRQRPAPDASDSAATPESAPRGALCGELRSMTQRLESSASLLRMILDELTV